MLAAQQARRGAPPEAVDAAAALADPATVAVVTGQQAGLFGGPLFTLLKAITAVATAARLEREHGVRAVAVFWIEAEDHDWDEVRTAAVFDAEFVRRAVEAATPDGAGTAHDRVTRLAAGDRRHGRGAVRRAAADRVHAVAAGRARARVPPGLSAGGVVRTTARAGARPARPGRLRRVRSGGQAAGGGPLRHASSSTPAAARSSPPVRARSSSPAATTCRSRRTPGAAALFDLDGGRHPIRKDGDAFVVGDDGRVTAEALLERARQRPETFSPNVLLRPLVQDTLFPTACYVAGPNELAYLAQLRGVYEAFGDPDAAGAAAGERDAGRCGRPALPRRATRCRSRTLQAQDERALNALLKSLLPDEVEQSLASARAAIAEHMQAVIAAMPLVDPTLEGRARSALGKMEHELEGLGGKVLQAAKRRDETLRRQFTHAQAQAFPDGEPQERAIGCVSLPEPLRTGAGDPAARGDPVDGGQHWVVAV